MTGNASDVYPNLLSLLSLYSPTSNMRVGFLREEPTAGQTDKDVLLWLMYNHLRVNTHGATHS